MAIVLLIVGSLMSGVLVAIGNSTENTRRTTARNQIRLMEDALYSFAQTRGYLPCPATGASVGLESPVDGGLCNAQHGFYPAATVGVPGAVNADGLLLDPWQNPYRYSIWNFGGTNQDFTNRLTLPATYDNYVGGNLMQICQDAACTQVITNLAAAVILSMGPNWPTYTSADEIANAGDGSTLLNGYNVTATPVFVNTTYSEVNFDDQITWISPYVLFGKMISAGTLP